MVSERKPYRQITYPLSVEGGDDNHHLFVGCRGNNFTTLMSWRTEAPPSGDSDCLIAGTLGKDVRLSLERGEPLGRSSRSSESSEPVSRVLELERS